MACAGCDHNYVAAMLPLTGCSCVGMLDAGRVPTTCWRAWCRCLNVAESVFDLLFLGISWGGFVGKRGILMLRCVLVQLRNCVSVGVKPISNLCVCASGVMTIEQTVYTLFSCPDSDRRR